MGPPPYTCRCSAGKYFNNYHYKCEILLEINDTCLQADSCKNTYCIGSPSKCQCLPFQYFDQIIGQCQYQFNITALSSSTTSVLTSTSIISATSIKTTSSSTKTTSSTIKSSTTSHTTTSSTTCKFILQIIFK